VKEDRSMPFRRHRRRLGFCAETLILVSAQYKFPGTWMFLICELCSSVESWLWLRQIIDVDFVEEIKCEYCRTL
jgi:hypothetical protein